MESESIVYGCIRDWPSGDREQRLLRRGTNRRVLEQLPQGDAWPFLGREMFSFCGNEGEGL